MTSDSDIRDPSTVKEELQDLLAYLKNLPPEIRRSGAFMAYEHRAGELGRELILSNILLFARQLPQGLSNEFIYDKIAEYPSLHGFLSRLAQHYERAARRDLLATRATRWGVLLTSTASLVSAVSPLAGLVIPLSLATASLAALLSVSRFGERAREYERAASHLTNLRDEIAHSYGPAGEVLTPSEYYTASTKRIERLLEEIKADVSRDRAVA